MKYVDDTILVADGSSDNLWMTKAILRGFELMTGLKINFLKSKVYDINVSDWHMDAALSFLNCDVDSLPFKYLGVKFGGNPRNVSMWKELIDQIKWRLATWRGKHLNMAGRALLINMVLNVIPVFSFLLYKAPQKVIDEIRKIQSKFLWQNRVGSRHLHWVAGSLFVILKRKVVLA